MKRVDAFDVFIWMPRIIFFIIVAFCLGQYLHYMSVVVPFQYDWGPSDGDHLNFAHRLAQGLPIYLSMKDGYVLSIYTPLYHGLIALLGGAHASLVFARSLSLLFWVLSPLLIFFYFRKDWGYLYATIAAIFIWLSAEPGMLMTAVYVTPTTMMFFLFLSTLVYGSDCVEKDKTYWWYWVALGVISALCYLAKQQGVIAITCIVAFMVIRGVAFRKVALVLLGFLFIFITSTIYFESTNSGHYLNATLFDLSRIMTGNQSLARSRLFDFLVLHNWAFTICVVLSFGLLLLRKVRLDIWHVSFILHIPLLLSILKNGGGGPDYFLTFWITMILISLNIIRVFDYHLLATTHADKSNNANCLRLIPNLLLMLLLGNGLQASSLILHELDTFPMPTQKLENLMGDYEREIGQLVVGNPQAKALTNRNIGALIVNNVDVENEGSTLFQYLWVQQSNTNRDSLLAKIKAREFDLITTGIQAYPIEIQNAIVSNYKVALTREVVFFAGHTGNVSVYIPNENI